MHTPNNTDELNMKETVSATTEHEVQNTDVSEEQGGAAGALLKLLAIIGLIGLLALATWVSIQIIRYAPVAIDAVSGVRFSSIFMPNSHTSDDLSFTLSTFTYQSGRPFTLSWNGGGSGEPQEYVFSYSCAGDVSFKVLRGTEVVETSCNEPYTFNTSAQQLVLVPTSDSNRFIDTTLSLTHASSGDSITTTVTIENGTVNGSPDTMERTDTNTPEDASTAPPAGESNDTTISGETLSLAVPRPVAPVYVPNPSAISNPAGRPDLSVSVLETGVIANVGGHDRFIALSPIPSNQRAAVRFVVENTGNRTSSNNWHFVAVLPIKGNPSYEYRSTNRQALGPSDKVEFTLSFEDITNGVANVRITLEGERDDINQLNNSANARLMVTEQ